MDISVILHSMIQLFVIMTLGYLLFKVGMLDRELNKKITTLLIDVTMPCTILSSVLEQTGGDRDMSMAGKALIITVVFYLVVPVLAYPMVKLQRVPLEQQGLYMFMLSYSNIGFMGIPIASALFGAEGVLYTAIFNIGFNIAIFTVGIVQINYGKGSGSGLIDLKKLLKPGVLFSALSLVVYVLNITLPNDLERVINMVGGITSPLAMMLVGATLASVEVKQVFSDVKVYPFALIKQVIFPMIIWAGLRLFVHDELLMQVFTVLILMPVANNSVMFSLMFDNDEKLAARVVFITTLLSMLTVPVMLHFLI